MTSRPVRFVGITLALLILTAWLYAPVRSFPFVAYDDGQFVTNNPYVAGGLTTAGVKWAFSLGCECSIWDPLTWISHMVDVELFGLDAGGHHLTSVVLHLLNTGLVFLLLWRLSGRVGPSAFVAALFGGHPLHVESVAWVAERKDVLSGFFELLTILAYLGYVRAPGVGRYLLVVFLHALALMAKPMAMTLPLLLLILDRWPLGRFQSASLRRLAFEKVPLLVLSAASGILALLAVSAGGAVSSIEAAPLGLRVANVFASYWLYVQGTLVPASLAVFYPFPKTLPLLPMLAGVALIAAVSAVAVRERRRHPWLLAGWLWYLVALVPVIGLLQVGAHARADHFMYLPIVGLFVIVGWGGAALCRSWSVPMGVTVAAGVGVVVVMTALASRQLQHWSSSVALWQQAVAVTPDSDRARSNLGVSLLEEGRADEAARELDRAVALNSALPEARNNFGLALMRLGRRDEAIAQYTQAIAIRPGYAEAHNNLGAALFNAQRTDEAIERYREATLLRAGYGLAHFNLGSALASQDRLAEAQTEFARAVAIAPRQPEWRCALGLVLAMQGQTGEAARELREAQSVSGVTGPACRALAGIVGRQ